MKRWRWLFAIWLVAGGSVLVEAVQCLLNPPIGKALREVSSTTRSIRGEDPSQEPLEVMTTDTERRLVITEEGGQRWLTSTLTKSSSQANGHVFTLPLLPAILEQPVGYQFDEQAQLLDIRGLEPIVVKAVAAGLDRVTPDALHVRFQRLWQGSLGMVWGALAGRRIEPGASWEEESVIPLVDPPLGEIPMTVRWTVLEQDPQDLYGRVRLRYEAEREGILLGGAAPRLMRWVALRIPQLAEQPWSSMTVTRHGELLIDPRSLIEHTEHTQDTQLTVQTDAPTPRTLHINSESATQWLE